MLKNFVVAIDILSANVYFGEDINFNDLKSCDGDSSSMKYSLFHLQYLTLESHCSFPPSYKKYYFYNEYVENVFIPYLWMQVQSTMRIDNVWDTYLPDNLKEST